MVDMISSLSFTQWSDDLQYSKWGLTRDLYSRLAFAQACLHCWDTFKSLVIIISKSFWRGFINAEETNRLQSILKKTIGYVAVICLLILIQWIDELLDSADHALFRIIVRNPHHVLHPLLPPRKRTAYNLRKITHGLTIQPVCSSHMRKNFLIRMLYTDIYWRLSVHLYCRLSFFTTDIYNVCVLLL